MGSAQPGPQGQPGRQDAVSVRLDQIIDHPSAPALVSACFDPDGPFAGETFVTLAYDTVDANRFEIADLTALTRLDVWVRPRAVRRILGPDADRLSELLEPILNKVDLWNAPQTTVDAACVLFERLRYRTGRRDNDGWGHYKFVDEVTAGKLLARKRQQLIPVVDDVVKRAVDAPPDRYWEAFRVALGDSDRRRRVDLLRPDWLDARIPLLRVLDAAIWIRFSGGANAKAARASVGL